MASLEYVYFMLHVSSSHAKLSEFPRQWLLMKNSNASCLPTNRPTVGAADPVQGSWLITDLPCRVLGSLKRRPADILVLV